jgi:transposase-like protein
MARKRPRAYPLEFRSKIIELARSGRRSEDLAAEFKVGQQTIRNWLKQAEVDAGARNDGLTSSEREEMARFENAFGNSKPNGTYCQKPRLGSLARPIRYLRSLRIRESASSPPASCHAVPCAGSLVQRVLRLAQSPALDESASGHRDRRRS